MTNFADVLTVLAAGGGLTLLLIMAVASLMVDYQGRTGRR
jgi:hypothetical protein